MQVPVIRLRDDSSFDCGDGLWQVVHEGGLHPRPWTLISIGEAKVSLYDSYECLDEALAALASCSAGECAPAFTVELPCGSSFRRPGKVGAEEVIASLGWVYVRNFIGYMPLTFPSGTSDKAVRATFRTRLGRSASMGQATVVGGDDAGDHWCADVFAACEGFVRYDAMQGAAAEAFAELGVGTLAGTHDFVARTNILPRPAEVFQFTPRHARSERPAA
jgi:hypothetical protein